MCVQRFALMILAVIFCGVSNLRGDDSIAVNEEYRGKTSAEKEKNKRDQILTSDYLPITLKAGMRLELTVKGVGEGRKVAVALWDADDQRLKTSWTPKAIRRDPGMGKIVLAKLEVTPKNMGNEYHPIAFSNKTVKLLVGEIPATGTYKIAVYSDFAGDYTVLATDLAQKRDAIAIKKELATAKRRVEELEKELMELDSPKVGK